MAWPLPLSVETARSLIGIACDFPHSPPPGATSLQALCHTTPLTPIKNEPLARNRPSGALRRLNGRVWEIGCGIRRITGSEEHASYQANRSTHTWNPDRSEARGVLRITGAWETSIAVYPRSTGRISPPGPAQFSLRPLPRGDRRQVTSTRRAPLTPGLVAPGMEPVEFREPSPGQGVQSFERAWQRFGGRTHGRPDKRTIRMAGWHRGGDPGGDGFRGDCLGVVY